jgi:mannose-6-phosphate isomerase-like protein (cupin superfamily)
MSLPYSKLDVEIIPEECLEECLTLEKYRFFTQLHKKYDNFKLSEQYRYASIYGVESMMIQNPPYYGLDISDVQWTQASKHTPKLVEWIKRNIKSPFYRIHILRMEPGGYITPHKDTPFHEEFILGAINWPEGSSIFFTEHGEVPFNRGETWIIDNGTEHSAKNESDEVRYVVQIGQMKYWEDIVKTWYS